MGGEEPSGSKIGRRQLRACGRKSGRAFSRLWHGRPPFRHAAHLSPRSGSKPSEKVNVGAGSRSFLPAINAALTRATAVAENRAKPSIQLFLGGCGLKTLELAFGPGLISLANWSDGCRRSCGVSPVFQPQLPPAYFLEFEELAWLWETRRGLDGFRALLPQSAGIIERPRQERRS